MAQGGREVRETPPNLLIAISLTETGTAGHDASDEVVQRLMRPQEIHCATSEALLFNNLQFLLGLGCKSPTRIHEDVGSTPGLTQ